MTSWSIDERDGDAERAELAAIAAERKLLLAAAAGATFAVVALSAIAALGLG